MEGFAAGLWKWGTVHQRFIRWQRKGMWKKLFEILKGDVSFEWLNDRLELCESASACSWRSWRKSGYIKDKRGLNSKKPWKELTVLII